MALGLVGATDAEAAPDAELAPADGRTPEHEGRARLAVSAPAVSRV
jgi:hypothetical protein